ncbi:hypothetical protein B0H63DRAFT_497134 [Podospora didyma]|uniref:Transcription factor TFIIIC triple barrel domain-containing protein n=1 Tax=Podospora didyma TaxID=330526 RepID=A0AAE0K5N3_9PEZI|nr:hypothetical protein B0H63DRAFT_497134 [Podospora didyma]
MDVDDDDEWEYEYSETEIETYYLTLDLSVRDFLERRTDDIIHNTRGGYRVWYNPLFNAPEPRATNPELIEDKDADDGELPEREEPDLDTIGMPQPETRTELPIDPLLQQPADKTAPMTSEANNAPADEIQILELHSAEPIVSYRNHIFRGTWAENIGTEMIFTPHDDKAPLPALRNLGHEIDLLAASAARINFKEATLVPRNDSGGVGVHGLDNHVSRDTFERDEDIPERYKRNGGIYVHIGGDKSGQRQPQAHFLEDLISLKRKRGEEDEVTIQSLETRQNRLMMEDEEEERRRSKLQADYNRMIISRQRKRGGGGAQAVPEESYIPRLGPKPAKGRRGGGPGSRPRTRRAVLIRREDNKAGGIGHDLSPGRTLESTPTPARWDDLLKKKNQEKSG